MLTEHLEALLDVSAPSSIDTMEDVYDIFHFPNQRLIDALKKDECDPIY